MAVVQGIKEKVHSPIYDAIRVPPDEQLGDVERSNTLKFFMNVQNKTKLETNLQSASLLPHYNTFEARAMRVVISDLPPEFSEDIKIKDEGWDVTDDEDNRIDAEGNVEEIDEDAFNEVNAVVADFEIPLARAVELLREAHESEDGFAALYVDEEGVTLAFADDGHTATEIDEDAVIDAYGAIWFSESDLKGLIDDQVDEKKRPLREQLIPNNGAGSILSKLIYNTVTTFFVGEKIMIQMPTWFFPSGAGPYSESGKVTTHGEPSPTATFRFAEPIYIDKQQNFRVELEIPSSDVMKELQRIYGPLFLWVVLDGYMTRDVQ
jgi:hypothetical protein